MDGAPPIVQASGWRTAWLLIGVALIVVLAPASWIVLTVLASAVGPLLLAWCVDLTGSYAAMFNILAAVIGLTAFSALMTPLPAFQINRSPAQ